MFGNVGSIITFRIGATDAEELETEFEPNVTPNDLINLTKYTIYLKLMINGVSSQPFSATTLSPIAEETGSAEKVIKVSRERYANPRLDIEEKITRWMGQEYHREAAQQDLTTEEQDDERGGVIFKGPSDPEARTTPAPTSSPLIQKPKIEPAKPTPPPLVPLKPAQSRPTPAPKPAETIWDALGKESEKKTQESIKKITKSLVFKFGEKTDKIKNPEPKKSEQTPPAPNTAIKPGETVKF